MKEIYQKVLDSDKPKIKPKKCKALIRTCRKCEHRFAKGETVCPECESERPTCNKWAIPGKDVCKLHGGKGGRPMTTGITITKATFSPQELETIQKKMKEKVREHEFIYQTAVMAYHKILEQAGNDLAGASLVLKAASEFLFKIQKAMNDIEYKDADMIHIHELNGVDKKVLQDRFQQGLERSMHDVLSIVLGIVKSEVGDESYMNIYNGLPEIYRTIYEKYKTGQQYVVDPEETTNG